MERRPYYEAYEDRYSQVHGKNLRWFSESPSPIVAQVIQKRGIRKQDSILEIGCGEGRDAVPLLKQGYNLVATDISPAAISFCRKQSPRFAEHYRELDCINGSWEDTYDFIYAISVVHMLVRDCDRQAFYRFVAAHLNPDGCALVTSMGDGTRVHESDISAAFDLQDRTHEPSGEKLRIAATSYRAVSFDTFRREMEQAGLVILEEGITLIEPDYFQVMYAVVKAAKK